MKMRYSTEQKYFKGYGFQSFARRFGNKYGKKFIDTVIKTGIDASKTASKRVVQKTAQDTGILIENKVADQISSVGKTKRKEKEDERQEIYIPPEKRQQVIYDLRVFQTQYNNGIPINYKLPRQYLIMCLKFITKKQIEVHDQ